MPLPGFVNVSLTPEARKATHQLVVEMTAKYRRRFTISEAIVKAAEDIAQEAALASSDK